jgi:hypothetical protein
MMTYDASEPMQIGSRLLSGGGLGMRALVMSIACCADMPALAPTPAPGLMPKGKMKLGGVVMG